MRNAPLLGNEMEVCPGVSVVIPTRGRPQLLMRAIASALGQTHADVEVIVVIDGPDLETVFALDNCGDSRLHVLALEKNAGGAEARNLGVRTARGEWLAFLDDDDEWAEEKLERQLQVARQSNAAYPIVSTRILARVAEAERVMPRRLYEASQNVSEYLFCRRGFAYGDGLLQTSTLLTKRALLLEVPFERGLKQHQDWDWILKAAKRADTSIHMLPEALTFMRVESVTGNVSRAADWKNSLQWARRSRHLMTRKAYAFFIATECVPRACRQAAGSKVIFRLFLESFWNGQPSLRQIFLFFIFWAVPEHVRWQWRNRTMLTTTT